MGTAPAPGAADWRPRRWSPKRGESEDGDPGPTLAKVVGEGANHCARGGRAPLQLYGYGLVLPALAVLRRARILAQQLNHFPVYGKDHLRFPSFAGRRC